MSSADSVGGLGRRYRTFAEFWPFYVSQHLDRRNRVLHFIGTTIANACLAALLATWNPALLLVGLVGSYGFAWAGHFLFEKNKPATFEYPLMSLAGDYRMYWLTWRGRMAEEADRVARSSSYSTGARP